MSEPGPAPAQPKRRFLPRFTLRTLTLCVLLAASGTGLWWKWEPWALESTRNYRAQTVKLTDQKCVDLREDTQEWYSADFSACGRYLEAILIVTGKSGQRLGKGNRWTAWSSPVLFDMETGKSLAAGNGEGFVSEGGGWYLREVDASESSRMNRLPTFEEVSDKDRPYHFLSGYGFTMVSPDNRYTIVKDKTGNSPPRLVDLETLAQGIEFEGLESTPLGIQFSKHGKYVWALGKAGLWETATGNCVCKPESLEKGWSVIEVSPDETHFVASVGSSTRFLYDIEKREKIAGFRSGRFFPDGKLFVEKSRRPSNLSTESEAAIYEIDSWKELNQFLIIGDPILFSPEGRYFATVLLSTIPSNPDLVLLLYDADSGREICRFSRILRFLPGGQSALAWSKMTGTREIIDLESGSAVASLQEARRPASDARKLLDAMPVINRHAIRLAFDDGTVELWQRRRPEQWWGVAWLPEFWLTVVFALLALWSLIRDFKTLRRSSVSHSNGGT